MVLVDGLLFLLACIFLVISGTGLVRSLLIIGNFLRFSEFVVAFLIMGISTSTPELFVGITSALNKNSSLSLGNIIGANILDLTLIAGLSILLSNGIKVKKKVILRDSIFMIGVAMLPVILMGLGNKLSRIDGIILILSFLLFNWHVYHHKREFRHTQQNHISKISAISSPIIFIISLFALFVSAHFVVQYGTKIAIGLNLPNIMIGLFLVSLGTTLPELAFELRAVKSKHPELAFGDLIGSIVTNSSLILGLEAIINPITANFYVFLTSAVFMIIICFLFAAFVNGTKISVMQGVSLILLYVFFVILELSIRGIIPAQTTLL